MAGLLIVEVADRRGEAAASNGGSSTDGADPQGSGSAGCDGPLDLDRWGRLAAAVARAEGVQGPAELGLRFVDEPTIAALAGRWLGHEHPTDVLAFPVDGAGAAPAARPTAGRARRGNVVHDAAGDASDEFFGNASDDEPAPRPARLGAGRKHAGEIVPRDASDDEPPPQLIGDVVVCPSVAARQAESTQRPLSDELALLVVHGVLHLLGHDHARRREARRMSSRTEAILARHHHP